MKKLFLSLLAIVSLATSCQETTQPPVDDTAFGSEISVDHQRIGIGQNVTFSVPFTLTPEATGIEGSKVVVNWVCNEGSSYPEDKNEGGVSYYVFNWNHVGEYTISCNTEYFFNNKLVTLQGPELKVTVEQSSFVNSFWGDDLEQVKKDNPSIQATNNSNIYGYTTSDNITYQFIFTDGKLSEGRMTECVHAYSNDAGYTAFAVKALLENKLSNETSPKYYYDFTDDNYTPTAEQQAALDLYDSKGIFNTNEYPTESKAISDMIANNGLIMYVDGKLEGIRSYRVAILGLINGEYHIAHYYLPL